MAIIINGTSGISGVDGSAGTPALQGLDPNTGISFGTDEVNINTGGTNRATVDSSGRLLVGTSTARAAGGLTASFQLEGTSAGTGTASIIRNGGNPYLGLYRTGSASLGSIVAIGANAGLAEIDFGGSDGSTVATGAYILAVNDSGSDWTSSSHPTRLAFSTTADGASSPTERMRLTSTGDLRFNSGFGSVATAYGVRAWIHFQGTGAVSINAHGNISGLTDEGTGEYTISFTTAMPDGNYATAGSAKYQSATNRHVFCAGGSNGEDPATGSLRFQTIYIDNHGQQDCEQVTVIVVR